MRTKEGRKHLEETSQKYCHFRSIQIYLFLITSEKDISNSLHQSRGPHFVTWPLLRLITMLVNVSDFERLQEAQ